MNAADPKRIVVVRFDRLGDMILGANLLRELDRTFPRTEIQVFCRSEVCSLRELFPQRIVWRPVNIRIDGEIPPDYVYAHVVPFLNEFHNLSHEILIVANYQRVWLDGLMTSVTKAPHRIGFKTDAPLTAGFDELVRAIRLDDRSDFSAEIECERDTTELEKSRRLTEFIVKRPLPLARPELIVTSEAVGHAHQLARDLFGRSDLNRRIVIWPGSSEGLRKSLSPTLWDRIVLWLRWRGYLPAFVGGPNDADSLKSLAGQLRTAGCTPFHTVRREELPTLAALFSTIRAFIGTDSGPAHLAQAVKCPALVVFGGGTWPRFNPLFGPAALVTVPVRCRGCNWTCPFETPLCVTLIRFQELRNALKWLLKQPREHNEVRYFEDRRPDLPWLDDVASAGLRYVEALRRAHSMHEDANRQRAQIADLRRQLHLLRGDSDPLPALLAPENARWAGSDPGNRAST